jgi:hypothetical protein
MMATTGDVNSMKETAQKALQANKDHQYALKVYTERLETELRTIDKLLVRHIFTLIHSFSSRWLGRILLILRTKMMSLNWMRAVSCMSPIL